MTSGVTRRIRGMSSQMQGERLLCGISQGLGSQLATGLNKSRGLESGPAWFSFYE